MLKKTFNIIESNPKPNPAKPNDFPDAVLILVYNSAPS